ncbi:MAG: cytochrome c-type biogenesis protein [Candidatus Promineifilaceae bacterium]
MQALNLRFTHHILQITFLLVALFFTASVAFAQDIVTDDEVNEVAHGLFCPVCESEPLDTCPTQACIDWREEIRVQLSEGQTQEQIYAMFRARYGDRVLAEPPVDGINLILWFTIPVALIVGGYLFTRYLHGISKPTMVTQSTSATLGTTQTATTSDDEYVRRIEEELRNQ